MTPRRIFFAGSFVTLGASGALAWYVPALSWAFALVLGIVLLGVYDLVQPKHAIRRNFPVVGRFRYMLEVIRPEVHQYFVESNMSGRPFSRELRSLVYRRALRARCGSGRRWLAAR